MARNDQRSIVQIQDLKTPQQINEAIRKLSASITKLEGRQGQIILRDGFSSLSTTPTAARFASEILAASDFGIFFTGVDGSDCWLASGAKLAPSNEWIATKTRAAFLKLSNISGGQFYFNSGLTIGASFIPILQSSPSGVSSFVWASYDSTTAGSPIVWDTTMHEDFGYFDLSSTTEVELLTDGVHQIEGSAALETGGGAGLSRLNLLINGSLERSSRIDTATPDSVNGHVIYHMDEFTAGDKISLSYDIGTLYTAESNGLNRLYLRKLITT